MAAKNKKFSSYEEYLLSAEWKILARLAREQAEYRCRVCNSIGDLHVHHREYPKIYGTEALSSLVVLCSKCHCLFHEDKKEKEKKPTLSQKACFESIEMQVFDLEKKLVSLKKSLTGIKSYFESSAEESLDPKDPCCMLKKYVADQSNVCAALLASAEMNEPENNVLTISIVQSFAVEKLKEEKNLLILNNAAVKLFGEKVSVKIIEKKYMAI